MTVDEFKKALLLAAIDPEVAAISSQDDVDMDKVSGIVLSDRNFVNFHKDNLKEVQLDFENEQVVLTYVRNEKVDDTWYERYLHQVFSISSVMKVLIRGELHEKTYDNRPFNLKTTVINEKYYMYPNNNIAIR